MTELKKIVDNSTGKSCSAERTISIAGDNAHQILELFFYFDVIEWSDERGEEINYSLITAIE
jgi:hypothetical protein